MIERLLTMRAAVLRSSDGAVDEYGNPVPGAESETEYDAWLAPLAAREITDDRQTEVSEFLLYLPAAAVIEARDRVRVEGVTYEVTEPPTKARRAREGAPIAHIEARVRWVRG